MKHFLFFITGISVFYFLFQACVPSKPVDDIEILPSERLTNKLEANRRRIKNFEGVGVIKVESDIYNDNANFRVVMQKPDSIYFTIMGPFGIELAQSLVTNDQFIFYDALENTAYTGEVNDDVLKNIFKVNISFSDLLDAFTGSVNLSRHLYKQPDAYSIEGENYVLTYVDAGNNITTTYKVDIRELGITYYSVNSLDGSLNLEGNYSDFELLENVAIPFETEITNKVENQKIKINYRNIVVNRKNLSVKFKLPDDVTMIEW